MAKFVCSVCGYVYEGDAAPEFCPQCKEMCIRDRTGIIVMTYSG